MFDLSAYLLGFAVMLGLAAVTWLVSLVKRDVSIVDSMWSIFFLAAALVYAGAHPEVLPRNALVLVLVVVWALRLAGYLTWRNWGEPEDHRYQKIRANNQPHFALKSLYLIFGLQAAARRDCQLAPAWPVRLCRRRTRGLRNSVRDHW
jgi:steroid 5-alpha reductase family enzyme